MKKSFLLALFSTATIFVSAQVIEVTPLFGYTVSGKVDAYYGTYDVKDDIMYGGLLGVQITDNSYVELSYRRNDPQLNITSLADGNSIRDIGIEQYMVGYLHEFLDGKIKPFAVGNIGLSRYFGKAKNTDRYWFLAPDFGVGAKMFFSDRIGIRLQTDLIMPLEFSGSGIFCGIGTGGSGCSADIVFNVPIVHWNLTAGLIIRLDD